MLIFLFLLPNIERKNPHGSVDWPKIIACKSLVTRRSYALDQLWRHCVLWCISCLSVITLLFRLLFPSSFSFEIHSSVEHVLCFMLICISVCTHITITFTWNFSNVGKANQTKTWTCKTALRPFYCTLYTWKKKNNRAYSWRRSHAIAYEFIRLVLGTHRAIACAFRFGPSELESTECRHQETVTISVAVDRLGLWVSHLYCTRIANKSIAINFRISHAIPFSLSPLCLIIFPIIA